jgi:four helix bundle protein
MLLGVAKTRRWLPSVVQGEPASMSTIRDFKQLPAWKSARELTNRIYEVSGESAFRRDFALRDQIRRASISAMSNIAEGFERRTTRLFVNFLGQAKASAGEVRSQLVIAFDRGYLDNEAYRELDRLSNEVCRQIRGFSRYLESSRNRFSTR